MNQKGSSGASARNRTFQYDSLSRLTSAANPESGTIAYAYDANGNLIAKTGPKPNQTGTATVQTTYAYDTLNRLTNQNYSDGTTPWVYYAYDIAPGWMTDLKNVIGRVANSTNQYGGQTNSTQGTATTYSYDAMGRVVREWEQTPSVSPGGEYIYSTYDLAGNLSSTTNASGTKISYAPDAASRLSAVTSSLNDTQHPPTLYSVDSSLGYYPTGAIRKALFGNGLTETSAFNNRLQPCRVNVNSTAAYFSNCTNATPSGNVLDFTMGYNAGTTDNGNVASWSAVGNQTFTRTYAYDSLNRIQSMADTASSQACKGLSWTIDAWGNMTAQTKTSGTCYSFLSTVGTNNQLQSGYAYDAAGNLTYDGFHYYSYDAENRVVQVDSGSTASYVYNENRKRVRKNTGSAFTEYFYGPNGSVQSEYNGSSWPVQYVYAGSQLLAEYTHSTTEFVHGDHLGSTRLVTAMNQSVVDNLDFLPYGQQTAGSSATTHKFTGKERDTESGLDNFGARYNASSMGRFMTPDWAAKPTAVPYARLGNPQSLNLYSYVENNPLSRNDPTGHILNCVSNQSQCGADLKKIAPGTKVGADGTVQKASLPHRILNHLDGHGEGTALITRLVNNSAVTGINPNSGDPHGGTAGGHTITYDPAGANGVLVRGADGNITAGHVSGAGVLGHELIHEDHAERGVQDFSTVMHTFTDGGRSFGELGRSEEFRTVGFSPFVRPGDITENQLNKEMGQPERATYTFDKNDFIPQP